MEKLNNSHTRESQEGNTDFTEQRRSTDTSQSKISSNSSVVEDALNLKMPDYVRVIVITDLKGRKRKLCIPASLDLDRPKRPRTIFSAQQLQILEMEFEKSHFVPESQRYTLSRSLGLSETQIKVWFQNRRTKFRRDSSESPAPLFTSPFPWIVSGTDNEKKTV